MDNVCLPFVHHFETTNQEAMYDLHVYRPIHWHVFVQYKPFSIQSLQGNDMPPNIRPNNIDIEVLKPQCLCPTRILSFEVSKDTAHCNAAFVWEEKKTHRT